MPVQAEDLRTAMRSWATGVTIVAAQYENVLHGMTVSSFTSVSLEPPLVLVSLEIGTRTQKLVEQTKSFGVTILSAEQQEVSNCFANPNTELGDRFEGREFFTLETGSPFIREGLAFFDCRVIAVYPAGNHAIIVGEVISVKSVGESDKPLLYFNRNYRELK
ncbi:MAG TPA: flavin reductase family protein [Anaerolineales bacterium]|nr:flavin reductase family protein [Anaerolineales bacterium]